MPKRKQENKNQIFQELFDILANGSRDEVKEVKKQIEKMWRQDRKQFKKAGDFILKIIRDFDQIVDARNKAAIISGMSIFYLALADKYFDELKSFIVKNLQHSDGRVREAARKTGDWLYVSLTSRADPFVYPAKKPLSEKQKSKQVSARKQYVDFVAELEALINKYDDKNEYPGYVDEMKPSVNKSLQLTRGRLTDSSVWLKIVEQSRTIPLEISVKRKEIKQRLGEILKEVKSDFDFNDIKLIIYNETGQKDFGKIMSIFNHGQDIDELNRILMVINDAWNYFPHKCLDGLSPAEKILESK